MKSQTINLKYTLNSAQTFLVVGCSDARVNLFMEEKKSKSLPHLMIDEFGNCYSSKVKRKLKPTLIGKGKNKYLSIGYRDENNKTKHMKIHRLVAEVFISNPFNKKCVNHKDGNKLNNHVSNLEWCTYSENIQHAIDNNLNPKKGSLNHNSKLTKEKALEIIEKYSSKKYTQKQLGLEYGVDQAIISNTINLKNKYIKK